MRQNNISAKKNFKKLTCSAYASERKLGEYFSPDTFKSGFQRVFRTFQRGFQHVPHSKEFQSVSKGFPKGFQGVSKEFPKGF